jgi:hypothetical protein
MHDSDEGGMFQAIDGKTPSEDIQGWSSEGPGEEPTLDLGDNHEDFDASLGFAEERPNSVGLKSRWMNPFFQ